VTRSISSPDHEVIVIGAGLSGICAGIKLAEAGIDYTIIDAADDIGGTWHANTYPGVQVDVASVAYSYSFEANPRWSRAYARGSELKAYIDHCADKYGLRPHIRLRTEIVKATFDAADDLWRLELAGGGELRTRYVIAGWGSLAQAKPPDIPGIEDFAGKLMHTSSWDADHDLRDERVAVVGTGATAVQLVPTIAPDVSSLSVFQRTAVWVLPRPDFAIPTAVRLLFRAAPAVQRAVRLLSAAANETLFSTAFVHHRQMPQLVRAFERLGRWWIGHQVTDPEVQRSLTPRYGFGCKRPTLSNEYLKSFNRRNVELVTAPIDHVTADGVVTADGRLHELDTILLATGFKVFEPGGLPPIEVVGPDGTELGNYWYEHRYQSYEGVSVPQFPNYFMTSGPYALGGPSYIFMIETNVRHAVRCIKEARRRHATRVEVRLEAHNAYFQEILRRQQDTVFFHNNCGGANSYYFDRHGDVPILRPATGMEMWHRSRTFDLDHYVYSNGAPHDAVRKRTTC
jgi:cation diffusion facilitator CzcD-associated flavoprotein CzcO